MDCRLLVWVFKDEDEDAGAGGKVAGAFSEIVSRESENVDVDADVDCGVGYGSGGGERDISLSWSCAWTCPSSTESLRACGWFGDMPESRRGDATDAEFGAEGDEEEGDAADASASVFCSSSGEIVTESDLAGLFRLFLPLTVSPASSLMELNFSPISPLRSNLFVSRPATREEVEGAGTAVRGVTGDVGGRARGTELIECAARLCACVLVDAVLLDDALTAVRVFVKVTVTTKGSPAKNAD